MDSKDLALENSETLKHIVLDYVQMKTFIKQPVIMKKAEGVWYEDIYGKKYLDGIAGIWVVSVGHNNSRIKKAMVDQLNRIAFAPPLQSTTPSALELAKEIAKITPGDINTVKFFSGGSEATEAAIAMARQYHKQTGNPGKYKIISRYLSYHGGTMGALSATGRAEIKKPFEPLPTGFIHVFPPYCYRCPFGKAYPRCGLRCATIVQDVIEMEGASSVAAFILEPIGSVGGALAPPPDDYFHVLKDICSKHKVLLIFDEVITGFGRTGEMFAAQTFHTVPDIICMGKGMSGGYAPLAAIAFRDYIADAFWGEDGRQFARGHTYGGNPLSAAAGLACIQEIKRLNLCQKAKEMGEYLKQRLNDLRELGVVGDVRGKGLMVAVEFVRDQACKEPFPNELAFGKLIAERALRNGLFVRATPHIMSLGPPLIIEKEEIDLMVGILRKSTEDIVSRVKR